MIHILRTPLTADLIEDLKRSEQITADFYTMPRRYAREVREVAPVSEVDRDVLAAEVSAYWAQAVGGNP